jgi:hypothetical protein
MSATPPVISLRFEPGFEQPEADGPATTRELIETLLKIQGTTFKHSGAALRAVHAKSNGLPSGELAVLPDLSPALARGPDGKPGRHPVMLRFSTNAGGILADSVSLACGLALSVLEAEGERMPGAAGTLQSHVVVDAPAFAVATPRQFLGSRKLLLKTTDTPTSSRKLAPAALRGAESLAEHPGSDSATVGTMGGHPQTNIPGGTFYSQVPWLHGHDAFEVTVVPVSPNLQALKARAAGHQGPARRAAPRRDRLFCLRQRLGALAAGAEPRRFGPVPRGPWQVPPP